MEGPNKTHLSLSLQFLLLSLNATLELLDGLLQLGHYDLLVLQTSHGVVDVLVLLLYHGLQFFLVPLKINDDLLGHLQVGLKLASLFFHVQTALLLSLVRVLQLVQSDLQLLLDLVEVVNLLLGLGQLLARLGLTLL